MKLCPKCQKHFSDDANFCPTDAARLSPIEGAPDGGDSLTARFELGDKLGGDVTGTVYRAKDKQTGNAAAVKIIAPAVIALPGVAQRLERELKQIERVHSAGVARVLASGKRPTATGDDATWIAMELVESAATLGDAIRARGPIPLDQAANLVEVIGESLIEAAQVGVVHRDLAPKNVLFGPDSIKLINFSLPVPTTPAVPGVPDFVAPEQTEGKQVDQRANLYSLGALYYFVLTGKPPGAAGSIVPPSQIAAGVPAGVDAAIMRALDKSPTKRFLTVRQFVDEVNRLARGDAAPGPSTTQPMGKVGGKPKAELMQTLLGVSKQSINGASAHAPQAASITAAPTVGTGMPVLAAEPMPAPHGNGAPAPMLGTPAPAANPLLGTMIGVASGSHAPSPAPASLGAIPGASVPPPERSPWAPPATANPVATFGSDNGGGGGAAPAVAVAVVPAVAAPVIAAVPAIAEPVPVAPVMPAAPVVPAAPVLAAPVVAAAKKKDGEGGGDPKKGKFRETMWFKKGDLDTQAAIAAAEESERTGKEATTTDKADTLPIDERYKDDGSITRGDKDKYSLRTGGTMMMGAVKDGGAGASQSNAKVSEGDLIGEMKGGRKWVFVLIGLAVVAVIVLIIALAR